MQRRTFLSLLASLPSTAFAQSSLPELQAEANRRRGIFLAQVRQMAIEQAPAIYFSAADPVFGSATAPRTVLVFTDFNCPYCRKMDALLQQVAQAWPNARFVLKWQTMMAESSASAANYALQVWQSARAQYGPVHQALMQSPIPITQQAINDIAQRTQTQHLLNLAEPAALKASVQLGQQLRVFATPSLLIGSKMMGGMTDANTLKATILQWPLKP
ncbi:DsbA family protein [Deefgea salmonis]|uniref:Thioredoxin domain-containing protein n=1 Tax=Deefgea salmonis TaxID=2875502 RepID=A0ABS8BM34_9NEIS|nr:thioredoxin domain-containing protein [Deefgea salmonis]MCB5196759.1 thioredoxin domain-containing protein [Deefgea salmonis]